MKNKAWMLGIIVLTAVAACRAEENLLFSMDFEKLERGLVSNSDSNSWRDVEGKSIIKELPGVGKVLASDGVDGGERQDVVMYKNSVPFGIQDGSKIAVEFDLMVRDQYSTALLGIGSAEDNLPLVIGALSADLFARSYGGVLPAEKALDEDGMAVELPAGKWVHLRSELDLKAGTGTLEYKIGDGALKPVFFDKAQTKREFSLGLPAAKKSSAQNWNGLYFRFSKVHGAIDNVRIIQR